MHEGSLQKGVLLGTLHFGIRLRIAQTAGQARAHGCLLRTWRGCGMNHSAIMVAPASRQVRATWNMCKRTLSLS